MKLLKLKPHVIAQTSFILGLGLLTLSGQGCGQMKSESGAEMSFRQPLSAPPESIDGNTPPANNPPVNNPPAQMGFPDASTTGVPAGVALKNTSGRTISVAGTVIDAENISGTLVISANNVTVKRSRITSGGYYVIEVKNGVTGFVLEDSEVNGSNSALTTGIRTASARISRCNIYGSVDGILITGSNTIIEDNYIHDMYAPEGAHVDPITNDGEGDNTIVRHNHIYLAAPEHTTGVMTFDAYWAPIKGIRVENNLLRGGTFVLRIENSSHGVSDAHILNNAFQKIGSAGYAIINTGEVSGNYDYLSNKNIDNQL